jgi:hypothetical protein
MNMKIYRFVAYLSLAVVLLIGIMTASLPIRFPHSIIAWEIIIPLFVLAAILVLFLFLKPLLPIKTFRLLLLIPLCGSIITILLSGLSPFFFIIFLAALGTLFPSYNLSKPTTK